MKTIILPGFSLHNKQWAQDVQSHLGGDVVIHEWKHWTTGNSVDFSVEQEAQAIARIIGSEHVNIIAKSIGAYMVVYMVQYSSFIPHKAILCGIPMRNTPDDSSRNDYQALARMRTDYILCIQNTNDPLGSFSKVEAFVHAINPAIHVLEKPRNDHEYPYFEEFKEFLK